MLQKELLQDKMPQKELLQDIMLQKRITSRHLLSFVRFALQSKVPMSAITSSMLQNSKCNPILMLDILLLTRVGSLSKKKKGGFSMTTPLSYSLCFGRDSLHFVMLTLTQYATKTRILGSTTHSPRFGGKK